MPSGYLHERCARQACALSGVTPVEMDALILGAQGPDPLFMLGILPLRPGSRPSPLGTLLHTRRTGAFLRALCRLAKERGPAERAFAMGFLTHYAVDSTVHPFVYAHSTDKNGQYSGLTHLQLEKRWDSRYYHRDGHAGVPYLMPGVSAAKAHWPAIAALWAAAIAEVYEEEPTAPSDIHKALRDSERINGLLYSPRGIKYALFWVLERLLLHPRVITAQMAPRFPPKADNENLDRLPWYNPADPETRREESLPELLERATRRAASLLGGARDYFDGSLSPEAFAALVGNAQYDTGMESEG